MVKLICAAIGTKKIIEFEYEGHHRVVEPHRMGIGKSGNQLLRAYQCSGTSQSGKLHQFKLWDLSKISNLKSTDRVFAVRPEYTDTDSAMEEIICEI